MQTGRYSSATELWDAKRGTVAQEGMFVQAAGKTPDACLCSQGGEASFWLRSKAPLEKVQTEIVGTLCRTRPKYSVVRVFRGYAGHVWL